MKRFTVLGAAALAAVAVTAAFAAGSASASVLCASAPESHICPEQDVIAGGTPFEASLAPGSKVELDMGFTKMTCTESSLAGNSEGNWISLSSVAYDGCNATISILKPSAMSFNWINGTHDGEVLAYTEFKVSKYGVDCYYIGPFGKTQIHGGSPARIVIDGMAAYKIKGLSNPTGFLCSSTANWKAEYEVETPNPLYVESE